MVNTTAKQTESAARESPKIDPKIDFKINPMIRLPKRGRVTGAVGSGVYHAVRDEPRGKQDGGDKIPV
jgi:hypothetical protein